MVVVVVGRDNSNGGWGSCGSSGCGDHGTMAVMVAVVRE